MTAGLNGVTSMSRALLPAAATDRIPALAAASTEAVRAALLLVPPNDMLMAANRSPVAAMLMAVI